MARRARPHRAARGPAAAAPPRRPARPVRCGRPAARRPGARAPRRTPAARAGCAIDQATPSKISTLIGSALPVRVPVTTTMPTTPARPARAYPARRPRAWWAPAEYAATTMLAPTVSSGAPEQDQGDIGRADQRHRPGRLAAAQSSGSGPTRHSAGPRARSGARPARKALDRRPGHEQHRVLRRAGRGSGSGTRGWPTWAHSVSLPAVGCPRMKYGYVMPAGDAADAAELAAEAERPGGTASSRRSRRGGWTPGSR